MTVRTFRSAAARWAAGLSIGALALTGCSGETVSAEGNPEAYCEAKNQLDAAAENLDSEEAMQNFLDDNSGTIDDMRNALPADVRDDFDTVMDNLEALANGEEVDEAAAEAADQADAAVNAFGAEAGCE